MKNNDNEKNHLRWMEFLEACKQGDVNSIKAMVHEEKQKKKTIGSLGLQEEGFCEACKKGQLEVVKYIMTDPVWKDSGHSSMEMKSYREPSGLVWAMQNGHVGVVDFILTQEKARQATWNFKNEGLHQGLWFGCFEGHIELVRYFLSPKLKQWGWAAEINEKEKGAGLTEAWTALSAACIHGHLDVVRYLLTSQELKNWGYDWVDLHASQDQALKNACAYGHVEVVKYLLTSMDLKEAGHEPYDKQALETCFLSACRACKKLNKWDLVHWWVMDYGIERSMDLDAMIKPYSEAQECFRVRDEFNDIKREVQWQQEVHDKNDQEWGFKKMDGEIRSSKKIKKL